MTRAPRARTVPVPSRAVLLAVRNVVVLATAAVLLAAAHVRRPATLCPLRALTGLPCPFCGGTTAAVEVGRLEPAAALRANPLVVLGAGLLALAPAGLARWWRARPPRARAAALAAAVAFAEVWQLVRFGVLPS